MDLSTSVNAEDVFKKLCGQPVFANCSEQEMSRMLASCDIATCHANDELYAREQKANKLWFIAEGLLSSEKSEDEKSEVSSGFVGEEAVLNLGRYLSTVRAVKDTTLVCIPANAIPEPAVKVEDNRSKYIFHALLGAFRPNAKVDDEAAQWPLVILRLLFWVVATIVPLLVVTQFSSSDLFASDSGDRWRQVRMLAVISCGGLLWAFQLVKPYIATLLMLFFVLAIGIVPPETILSGFASEAFFMTLSLFGLGAVVVESGIITRFFLGAISFFPNSRAGRVVASIFTTLCVTPVLPSETRRVKLLTPLLPSLLRVNGTAPASAGATKLVYSLFSAMTLFSPLFLTGAAFNMALYGALPSQVQSGITWLPWLEYVAVAGAVILIGSLLLSLFGTGDDDSSKTVKATSQGLGLLNFQRSLLGRTTIREWTVIGIVLLYMSALMSSTIHKVDHQLIAFVIFGFFLVTGILKSQQLKTAIDWNFLILLGALIGIVNSVFQVGLPKFFAAALPTLSLLIEQEPAVFIAGLAITAVVASWVIPCSGLFLGMFVIPLTAINGFSPWVAIFVILLMTQCSIKPVQTVEYERYLERQNDGQFNGKAYFGFCHWYLVALRFVALAVSIPYWQSLELI